MTVSKAILNIIYDFEDNFNESHLMMDLAIIRLKEYSLVKLREVVEVFNYIHSNFCDLYDGFISIYISFADLKDLDTIQDLANVFQKIADENS